MHSRRFLAALLAFLMLFGAVPSAFAREGQDEAAGEIWPEEEDFDVAEMVDVEDLAANGKLDDKGWWNILLLGGDSRADGKYGRTDAIIILSVNPASNQVKLTSIMRDTWVNMYGVGQNRINAACKYGGPELVMRTINEHFDMNLTDYALVNMAAFKDIVDIIGGIEMDVTEREVYFVNEQQYYNLKELGLKTDFVKLEEFGEDILLDGNQALAYVRIRHADSDYVRTGRQRDALVAIAKKLQSEGSITTIASVVLTMLGYVETNLTLQEILQLCGVGFQLDMDAVEQLRLPVDGTYNTGEINGAWCIQPNFKANAQALYDYIYNDVNPQAE
ncbi:MAG: LCP family protein [Clostridia bacterium]|nr:LCP family protein [Clostridia bacterium]